MSNYAYNPFTSNLDLVGSGASYIDGVVATPASLPVTQNVPALDSVYLAKAGSGVWLISRRPAGLYCRVANNGNLNDWQHLGAFPEVNSSANWELYDGTDPTKELKFDLSGISTGTTRTLTAPNASGTIALTSDITGGIDDYTVITSSQTATNGARIAADTTAGAFTLTLPASPSNGDTIYVLDYAGTFDTNNLTIARNGSNIESLAENMDCNLEDAAFSLVYVGSTVGWKVVPYYGAKTNLASAGPIGSTIPDTAAFTTLSASTSLTVGASDTELNRDSAGIFRIRNQTSAATGLNLYNTTAVATNYERGFVRWVSNIFQIGTEKLGSGTRRALELVTDGTARWRVGDGSITAVPTMLALGNSAIFGANEGYSVIIATGGQGTTNAGVFTTNGSNTGYLAIGESLHLGLLNNGTSGDVRLVRDAANVLALRNGASTPQAYRIYNTVSGTSNVNFERANFRWASNEFIIDAEAGGTGTALRGIKIGSAATSLLGFYGAPPATRPTAVADATDAASAITQLNALLARMRTLGLIAT